jgi:hypothetical protein
VKRTTTGRRRWAAMVAGAALSMLLIATVAAQSTEIVQSITGGGQPTITIDSVSLQPVSYSAEEQYSPGQLAYSIDALSGTAPGWTVSVQVGDLTYSGEHGGADIPAANLTVAAANAPGYVSGDQIDGENGPFVPADGATGGLNTPRNVLSANQGFGDGTYNQSLDLSLTIPGGASPGTYSGTITFSTNSAP